MIDDGYSHGKCFAFLAYWDGDIVLVWHRVVGMVCSVGDLGRCHCVLFVAIPRKVDFRLWWKSTTLISSLHLRIWWCEYIISNPWVHEREVANYNRANKVRGFKAKVIKGNIISYCKIAALTLINMCIYPTIKALLSMVLDGLFLGFWLNFVSYWNGRSNTIRNELNMASLTPKFHHNI